MVRYLTPEKILFSPGGRLRLALMKVGALFLPGRFAVWLSLLEDRRLERHARVKLGPRSLIPGSRAYAVPRLHLIVERADWLALQAVHHSPDSSPSQQNLKSGLALRPLLDLLRRLGQDGLHRLVLRLPVLPGTATVVHAR